MTTTADPQEDGPATPPTLRFAVTTALLLLFATFFVGVQMNGVRAGTIGVLAILLVTVVFARAAYTDGLPRPFNASLGVLLLALLAGLTALSISWSLLPNSSLLAALRLISYAFVLALAAFVAQRSHDRAGDVLRGIGWAALVISAYALFSHCFPGLFGESDNFARLRMPFGYWNAVGTIAAIGVVAALWAGTRRDEARRREIASYPAGGLCLVALMLSQSRGALLALLIVIAIWLVLMPQRLRSVGWCAVVGAFSLVVVFWAYNKSALSTDAWPMNQRESAGIQLFVALLLLTGVLTAAGFWLQRRRHTHPLAAAQRQKLGKALLVLLAISPFVLVAAIGVGTNKGLTTISDEASSLFSTTSTIPDNSPGRLTQTSSLRARYWSDSYKIFKAHPLKGTGGDTFLVARLPYRHDQLTAAHAHGMVPQVAADLGVLGLLILVALAAVWLLAAFKLAGAGGRAPTRWLREADEVRLASVTIMLIALLFGLESAIDWIWFVPGVAFFGLLAGGWVLGSPAAHAERAVRPVGTAGRTSRTVRTVAITVVGLVIAYAVYQPVLAERKVERGLDLVEQNPAKALKLGNQALNLDPTSDDAYILVAVAQANGGRAQAAEETLVALTTQQPGNPTGWLRLATFRLNQLHDPDGAIDALGPLLYQSANSIQGLALLDAARKAKVDALLQRTAERRRKQLQKMLEQVERMRRAQRGPTAPSATPAPAPPG